CLIMLESEFEDQELVTFCPAK
uniref:Uncharacterized protein n=1 Tax=Acrobeloides nanus TaxID=290746 RepID=A0A914DK94_9BILA